MVHIDEHTIHVYNAAHLRVGDSKAPAKKQAEAPRFPRFAALVSFAVTVVRYGKLAMIQGVSTDLAEGGIGGMVDCDLELGEYVLLSIWDSRMEAQLESRAQVRYRKGNVYGFSFFNVSPMEQVDVQRICQRLAKQPLFPHTTLAKP
jgi:hypothetical protein